MSESDMMSKPGDGDDAGSAVVYYDGTCLLCRREIGFYRRMKGADAIVWRDVGAVGDGGEIEPGFDKAEAMARFHMRRTDGARVSGAAAFLDLWEALPGWRRLAAIRRVPGMEAFLERFYVGFLKVRPGLSRGLARLGL